MPKVTQPVNGRANENSLTTVPSCLLDYLAPLMTHPQCPFPSWPHIPRCVLVTKFPIPDRSGAPSSLLTGPSFHMRSKPPTLFSLPVSLDGQEIQGDNGGAPGGARRPRPVPRSLPAPYWCPCCSFVRPFPGGPDRSQRGHLLCRPQAPTLALSNMNLLILKVCRPSPTIKSRKAGTRSIVSFTVSPGCGTGPGTY